MLQDFGIEEDRFRLEWVSASEGPRFAQVVTEMTEKVKALGPSQYKHVDGEGIMELARRFDGKKFMWDGQTYPDQKQAEEVGPQIPGGQLPDAAGGRGQSVFTCFTRREVKEVVVEGKP